jgi:hypothetical protein
VTNPRSFPATVFGLRILRKPERRIESTVCPRGASFTHSSDLTGVFFVVLSEFRVYEKHESRNVGKDVVRPDLRSSNISSWRAIFVDACFSLSVKRAV